MFYSTVGCILITALAVGANPTMAAEPTVAEQVGKLKLGRKIKVELNNGETLKGWMGSATADQFALEPGSKATAQGTARMVRFNEVRSVKADGLTAGQKWAIFGLVWLAIGIAGSRV